VLALMKSWAAISGLVAPAAARAAIQVVARFVYPFAGGLARGQ
jgi:hypothetical protein